MSHDMTSRELYLRLLTYVRPYWKAFLAALACMGVASLAEPVFPAIMKSLLDDGFSKANGPWDWLFYPAGDHGHLPRPRHLRLFRRLPDELGVEQRRRRIAPGHVRPHGSPADPLLQRQPVRSPDVAHRLRCDRCRRCSNQCPDLADQGFAVHHRPARLAVLAELAADADYPECGALHRCRRPCFQQAPAQRGEGAAGIDGQDHAGIAGGHRGP